MDSNKTESDKTMSASINKRDSSIWVVIKKVIVFKNLQLLLVLILLVFGGLGLFNVLVIDNLIDESAAKTKEAARPANLEIITVSDERCVDCAPITGYLEVLKQQNVNITSERNIDISESEAWKLIDKYKVEKVPFFIASGEVEKGNELKQIWSAWGQIVEGSFVLTNGIPPYLNLVNNQVEGRVTVTYLTDSSCTECYDVNLHKTILKNSFGVVVSNENSIDISDIEGKEIVEKYNITQVPTFIADNQVAVYKGLLAVWNQVGSIEQDGSYVFRKTEQLGTYFDISKGEVVIASSTAGSDQPQ